MAEIEFQVFDEEPRDLIAPNANHHAVTVTTFEWE